MGSAYLTVGVETPQRDASSHQISEASRAIRSMKWPVAVVNQPSTEEAKQLASARP
jgi:hypothetical protein